MIPVSSARLTFRSWTEKDAALAEALWCDSEVTHYFGGAMTREQAHNRLDIERERENRLGVQYWPMFLRETGEFVGCAGLRQWQMDPKMIEAGVHLMRSSWGLRLGEEAFARGTRLWVRNAWPADDCRRAWDRTQQLAEAARARGFCLYAQHHVWAESDRSTHVRDQCGDVAFDRDGERERLSA